MTFQAWASINNGEYQYWQKVGRMRDTEPEAWQEVHAVGMQFWPHNPARRRVFEGRCKITEEKANAI